MDILRYYDWLESHNPGVGATIPDVYCDQFNMAQSAYGVALTFSLSPNIPIPFPGPGMAQAMPQVIVRMSLEHAKAMAMVLRRSLKQYELEQLGDPIKLPVAILRQMGLSEEDW